MTASEIRRAKLTAYRDIPDERVEWLWPLRVPLGAVTLIAGQPGLGKSQVSLALAAKLTRGELPCGEGSAIIATNEDHRAAVIRPRLRANQANLGEIYDIRVGVLDGTDTEDGIVLPLDVAELERSVEETGARLVVLDPLVSFLAASVDSWKDASVRQALAPLAMLAERQGCSVVGIVHVNKVLSGDPFQRIGGSVGFQGAPRSVLVLGRDPDDEDRRVLLQTKSNYGRTAPGLLLGIEPILLPAGDGPEIETSRIVELGATDHDAESVLGSSLGDEGRSSIDEAREFLSDTLSGGPVDAAEVKREAKAAGIGERTLSSAKAALGIRMPHYVKRVGGAGALGHWTWELPKSAQPITPICNLSENPHESSGSGGADVLTLQTQSNGPLSEQKPKGANPITQDGHLSEKPHESSDKGVVTPLRGPSSSNGSLREQDAGRFADEQSELFGGRLEDLRRAAEEGRLR
jgi:hypothetical protein